MATLASPIATSSNLLSLLAWLATAFLIGQAATQPLSGKFTDIFSRQSGFIASSLIFTSGNIICGLDRAQWTMILGRLVAGVGGGCVNTILTIFVSDLIPLRQRVVWQGVDNDFWGITSLINTLDDINTRTVKDNCIYMDAPIFACGYCGLQVTMQLRDIAEARKLHDQFIPLAPVMLASTVAAPVWKGFLADTDVRWNTSGASVDDRSPEQRGEKGIHYSYS